MLVSGVQHSDSIFKYVMKLITTISLLTICDCTVITILLTIFLMLYIKPHYSFNILY